jgi:hypothetical protein
VSGKALTGCSCRTSVAVDGSLVRYEQTVCCDSLVGRTKMLGGRRAARFHYRGHTVDDTGPYCQVGAVVFVGAAAFGPSKVAWGLFGRIVLTWILTLPLAGLMAAVGPARCRSPRTQGPGRKSGAH